MPSHRIRRQVFLSHAFPDTWVARQLAREIEELGATTFLDEAHIAAGADFEERILAELRRSHELVVLLTPWALERRYVWAEIGAAWGRRLPIIGLLHGLTAQDIDTKPSVPVIKSRNLIQLNNVDKYFTELRSRIKGQARVN
jgi:hypothetical protein